MKVKTVPIVVVVALGTLIVDAPLARAQMFRPSSRTFGSPLSRQPGFSRFGGGQGVAQAGDTAGTLEGNERFLRSNRRPTDFVGPDLTELSRFIGDIRANIRRQVRPAAEDLREPTNRSTTINRPRAPAAPGTLYDPRIVVSLDQRWAPSVVAQQAVAVLGECQRLSVSSRIEVSMAGRTATLRGAVPVESDRNLATMLLAFEPGISTVRNELVVDPRLAVESRPDAGQLPADAAAADPSQPMSVDRTDASRATPRKWLTLSHATKPAVRQSWSPDSRSRSY